MLVVTGVNDNTAICPGEKIGGLHIWKQYDTINFGKILDKY